MRSARWAARTRSGSLLVALVLVCLGAACNDDATSDGGEPRGRDQRGQESESSVVAAYDQAGALDDGQVTDGEMSDALAAAAACLSDLGFPTKAEPTDASAGFQSGWSFDVAASDGGLEAVAVCREATYGDMELGYVLAQRPAAGIGARAEAFRRCLSERGVDAADRPLSVLVGELEADHLAACAPASAP